jgi:ABC-type transporter Mla subunit MlaD
MRTLAQKAADDAEAAAIAASNAAYQAQLPALFPTGVETPLFIMPLPDGKAVGYLGSTNGPPIPIVYARESPYDFGALSQSVARARALDDGTAVSNRIIRAQIEELRASLTNLVAQFQDVQTAHDNLVSSYTNMADGIDALVAAINARAAPSTYITNATVATLRAMQATNDVAFSALKTVAQRIKANGQDVRQYAAQSKQAQQAALQTQRDVVHRLRDYLRGMIR